jgi:hypothetical protein
MSDGGIQTMKVEILVPNPTFQAAQKLAQDLNMSLSDLYTIALNTYMTTYGEEITEQLNAVYDTETFPMEPELIALQIASIGGEDW